MRLSLNQKYIIGLKELKMKSNPKYSEKSEKTACKRR